MENQTKVLYPKAGKPSTKPGKPSGKRRTTIVKPPKTPKK
jgi:hypothetical protein